MGQHSTLGIVIVKLHTGWRSHSSWFLKQLLFLQNKAIAPKEDVLNVSGQISLASTYVNGLLCVFECVTSAVTFSSGVKGYISVSHWSLSSSTPTSISCSEETTLISLMIFQTYTWFILPFCLFKTNKSGFLMVYVVSLTFFSFKTITIRGRHLARWLRCKLGHLYPILNCLGWNPSSTSNAH